VGADDYEEAVKIIRDKVVARFDFKGIEDKLKRLERLGIDVTSALALRKHITDVQSYYPDGRALLLGTYEKRNDVVHRNQLIFSDV
jgi:hypothetical protein